MYVYIIYIYMGSFIPFTTFKKFCHSWLLTDVVKAEDLTATPWVKRRSLMWAWIRTHGMAQPLLGANAAHGGGGGDPSWALQGEVGTQWTRILTYWCTLAWVCRKVGDAAKWAILRGKWWSSINLGRYPILRQTHTVWERGRERERDGVGEEEEGGGGGEGALHKTEGRAMLVGFMEALPGQSIVSKCCEWHQPAAEGLLQGPRQIECDPLRESPSLLGDA